MVADTPTYTACSAFNLIALIAVEPVIAHYIQEADFENDSLFTRGKSREIATNMTMMELWLNYLSIPSI